MVADFISADYGWLRSLDGAASTRILFRAGANRDGYFDNDNILQHSRAAMDILERDFPDERHVLVFDNATTHLKRADGALSARHMSKKPTSSKFQMWGVDINARNESGAVVYGPDRKPVKERVCMEDARFHDGEGQPLYFNPEDGTGRTCVFKGMDNILIERGFSRTQLKNLLTQCEGFHCPPNAVDCCTRRLLWNQPDFVNVKSLLETECEKRGFTVLFLPKFHCELNFIERCWGNAKRRYRTKPASASLDQLEVNVIDALDSVPLQTMRRSVSFSGCYDSCRAHLILGMQPQAGVLRTPIEKVSTVSRLLGPQSTTGAIALSPRPSCASTSSSMYDIKFRSGR
jgi:hypothetical protein